MSFTFFLCDQRTDAQILELTYLSARSRISPRLNRPLGITLDVPADEPTLQGNWTDGEGVLAPGLRTIKAYKSGTLVGHSTLWTASWSGGVNYDARCFLSALDPMARFPTRYVWDDQAQIADLQFTTPITAATLVKKAVANSITNDDIVLSGSTPAKFPVETTTGIFSASTNVGAFLPDGPHSLGDLITTITDAGVADVVLLPVDTSGGYAAGIMAQLNVKSQWGSDISASVSFQYATGSKNVESARRVLDVSNLGNRLTYELGPKLGEPDHWTGNITATQAGFGSYLSQALASREKYGVFHQVRVYDSDSENLSRPLYESLWKAESTLRDYPRDLLYMKPVAAGAGISVPEPFSDYNIGDIVGVSASALLGPAFAGAKQRVYGFDIEIDENGVERVSELITSADAV